MEEESMSLDEAQAELQETLDEVEEIDQQLPEYFDQRTEGDRYHL